MRRRSNRLREEKKRYLLDRRAYDNAGWGRGLISPSTTAPVRRWLSWFSLRHIQSLSLCYGRRGRRGRWCQCAGRRSSSSSTSPGSDARRPGAIDRAGSRGEFYRPRGAQRRNGSASTAQHRTSASRPADARRPSRSHRTRSSTAPARWARSRLVANSAHFRGILASTKSSHGLSPYVDRKLLACGRPRPRGETM